MTTYKFLALPELELVRGVCGIGDDLRWRGWGHTLAFSAWMQFRPLRFERQDLHGAW